MSAEKTKITVAHSPDADDAFMFYALAKGKVSSPTVEFEHVLGDIQSLNVAAREGRYEMTAISYHAYPYVADKYILTSAGSSVGDGYGPLLVAREPLSPEQLKGKKIAIPGLLTTAYLTLRIFQPDFEPLVIDFDRILEAVESGEADAGLIIHEGQLSYSDTGMHKIVDLGEWWKQQHNLPLPLGANCILRSLDPDIQRECRERLSQTIQYALDHREDALDYALGFGRGIDRDTAHRFVGMYVNHHTVRMAPEVLHSAQILLDQGHDLGIIPNRVQIEYV